MKNVLIVIGITACFLLCGFQQGKPTSSRKPEPRATENTDQNAERQKKMAGERATGQTGSDSSATNGAAADNVQDRNVRIISAPEVGVRSVKDRLDWTVLICTVVLTCVGIAGTIVALRTLSAIKRQAEIMEQHRTSLEQLAKAAQNTAEAADLNAKVLMAAQRPQIAIDAHGNPTHDLLSDTPRVQIEISNKGAMPAQNCLYESWIELLPFPFSGFTPSADHFKSVEAFSLYLGHKPVVVNIPFTKGLSDTEKNDARQVRRVVCFRVRLTYNDPFDREGRGVADFGCYVTKDGLGFLPG